MAFTVDLTAKNYPFPAIGDNKLSVLKTRVDFTSTANQLAQNQMMAVSLLPAGTVILWGWVDVITADADVSDVDLGYNTSASTNASISDALTFATTGYKVGATTNMTTPQYLVADNYVILTNKDTDTINGAVIDIILLVLDART